MLVRRPEPVIDIENGSLEVKCRVQSVLYSARQLLVETPFAVPMITRDPDPYGKEWDQPNNARLT
jgi:hypothetical protein